ncbi:MAG: hypothetical protein IJK45_07750 [Bacteroidaceae bacterium]|nr:hypothetical protein [Bacteroidaceae bacterium]
MTNLRLTGFLIFGLALTMGIVLWVWQERLWASVLFALAFLQGLIIALNWNKERKRRKFRKL